MNIQTTDEFSNSYGIKCLINGASGSGKTFLVSTLLKEYKPVLISAESGTLSLRGFKVPMIDISRDDAGKSIEMKDRLKRLFEIFSFIKEGKHDFDTIFLDSLTEVNECLMAALRVKFTDPSATLKMYGENSEMMKKIVKEFRDLKYNVVIVSLSTVEKDDIGKRFITSDVVGKVANQLPSFFDEVFHLGLHEIEGKTVRKLQCNPSESIVCKDRSGVLKMHEDADLGIIFNKIKQTNKQKEK